jgi:hypothetical protein
VLRLFLGDSKTVAKKNFAVLCDQSIEGHQVKAGSIVVLDEKAAKQYEGMIDSNKAACDHFAKEYNAKPIDLTEAAK